MFSQIFTKAKGLFTVNNLPAANESSFTAQASTTPDSTDNSTNTFTPATAEMVTGTRRGQIGSPHASSSDATPIGKRKTRATRTDSQSNKRRRMDTEPEDDLKSPDDSVVVEIPLRRKASDNNVIDEVPETQQTSGTGNGIATTEESQDTLLTDPPNKANNHIRFGSEEPTPATQGIEEIPETQPVPPEEESSDDDDEAPEVVDNSAQLLSLKMQAQKLEEARRRDEILRKEKRKLKDERNKSQAKASNKSRPEKRPAPRTSVSTLTQDDDLVSESTGTLQGSVVRDSGRMVLPALLPDEILNAEPVYRLPSPAPEQKRKSTKQHKFFDDDDKPAKDMHRGDVTIRVLDSKKAMLPPKSSKAGRNLKAAWMAGQRNKHSPSGLKRATGGPKGFVRR